MKCGEQHPDGETSCFLKVEDHGGHHWDKQGRSWEHTELVKQVKAEAALAKGTSKKSAKQVLTGVAAAASQGRRETLARERGYPHTGVPAEAVTKWDSTGWTREAEAVFREFLRTRQEPFTTAEDVWPLLDRPEEMRAMSVVTQRLLRSGAIEEVASKRLRGIYRTRDGHEFAENKLVPVYRSSGVA